MDAELHGLASPASSSLSPSTSQTSVLTTTGAAAGASCPVHPLNSSPSTAFPPSINPSPSSKTRSLTVRFADHFPAAGGIHAGSQRSTSSRASTLSTIPPVSPGLDSSASSSPQHSPSSGASPPSSPQYVSPTSSAFVSASGSPFISPPAPSSTGSTPAAVKSPPREADREGEIGPSKHSTLGFSQFRQSTADPDSSVVSLHDPSRDAVEVKPSYPSSSLEPVKSSGHVEQSDVAPLQSTSLVSSAGPSAPPPRRPLPLPGTSASPSSSARPRSCDVYIGLHGQNPSLLRFSKWLRAELELQGIACFSADRARFSDFRSHDIALRIINSCTFGVVIITKRTFRNLYSVEELRTFLSRKNLVPLFLELAPTDCLPRDIVEKRGEVWEKDGGELWRLFDGDEREWTEAVDGLSRVEEWKLEAYTGSWRNCILKAVSLLGTRLGRRSVAERERMRKERVEGEEFPFPRNCSFVGRERELKALEGLLFADSREPEEDIDAEKEKWKEFSKFYLRRKNDADKLPRNSKQSGRDAYLARRRSDADRWQRQMADVGQEGIIARRKSDSDSWHDSLAEADDNVWLRTQPVASSSGGYRREDLVLNVQEWETQTEIEVHRGRSLQRFKDGHRSKNTYRTARHRQPHVRREIQSVDLDALSGQERGIACISGASGIGKTEMVLEYAYRFSQRYRMVLWVGGEARYLRQNYLNLSLFLGLDVGTESQVGPERGRIRTFDEQEMEAFQRVKRELQRDVPYLLIIDNLESERDWWDGREILELIPRAGGATHVIFTTRIPKLMNLESLELSYLSGVEALSLMRGKREFSSQELDALKEIEEKLGRLTLGLGIVGILLSELPMMPSELLEKMEKALLREWNWGVREDATLQNNPFLVKLLGVCFSILEQTDGPKDLSTRMAWVGGWFAPFPIPLSLLVLAASNYPERSQSLKLLKNISSSFFCCCASTQSKRWEAEAGALLVKYGLARTCTRQGWIHFHEIVQLYSRKRGGVPAAKAMVQGVRKRGAISLHSEHFWAACFLVLGFGNDPVTVELKVVELLSFIRRGVLQLAIRAFTSFSRCHAALELLRLCTNMLEDIEKSFVSQIQDWWDRSLCWRKSGYSGQQVDEYVWQDVTLLKAQLLETRAKLMLKGGQFDAGEEICRTCISIRTVMLGQDHPDTLSAQETLMKLVSYRSNV